MKYIKKFESFYDVEVEHYRYIDLEHLENGNLKIILNDDGITESEDDYDFNESNFFNYFEDIETNSEYMYFQDMSQVGVGMTEAPCITFGYYLGDDGKITDNDYSEYSEIFYYTNYMIKDFTEELKENGFVIFRTNKPNSKEQIEENRLKKSVNKYNL
jgi:hypothetical protein